MSGGQGRLEVGQLIWKAEAVTVRSMARMGLFVAGWDAL